MENIVIVLLLLAITAGIIWYLIRAKRRGETCIGCPYCGQCGHKDAGCCQSGAGSADNTELQKATKD